MRQDHVASRIEPIGDRVLALPIEDKIQRSAGGIYIPDTAKDKPTECVVVALGTGKTDDNGNAVPFPFKVGDRLLVSKYGGAEVEVDHVAYKILNSDDIMAIIRD